MEIKLNCVIWKLIIIVILLLAATFILSSCTCVDKSDGDVDDDADDDDTDNDDTDDDDAEGWHIYTIDSGEYVGGYSSITVDSNDKVHISYLGGIDSGLTYATNRLGSWQIFKIQAGYINNTSIAVDSNNQIHISYYNPYSEIKYATNKSGSWQTFVIFPNATSGEDGYNSICVDSSDKVHIAFFHCGGLNGEDECSIGALKYATNKTGSWQISTIDDPSGDVEAGRWYLSMVMDSNDKIHVSYFRCSGCGTTGGVAELWYATNAAGSWQRVKVSDGEDNSIAVDSNGKAYISFYDQNKNLSYVTNISGTWQIVTVDSSEKTGQNNSIAIDSNGFVHISYHDDKNDTLKYATNQSGTWETLVIDDEDNGQSSIAVDSEGYVHISYYVGDYPDHKLKYATNRPPD